MSEPADARGKSGSIPTASRQVNKFADGMAVMRYLQSIGENNSLLSRRAFTPKATIDAAVQIYGEAFPHPDGDGVQCTFETVNFVGWAPDASQPQAKCRGSGEVSLKSLAVELGTDVQSE